jgi:hypothetical protein
MSKMSNTSDIVTFALDGANLDMNTASTAFSNPETILSLEKKLDKLVKEFLVTNERTKSSLELLKKPVGRYLQDC